MKLRLRCLESKETLRIEVPDPCSLRQLQQALPISSPSSLRFSLNRKDELLASSTEDSLQSLGVTSGDLIYYSRDPHAFLSPSRALGLQGTMVQDVSVQELPQIEPSSVENAEDSLNCQAVSAKIAEEETSVKESPQNQASDAGTQLPRLAAEETLVSGLSHANGETSDPELALIEQKGEFNAAISCAVNQETIIHDDTEAMDIDDESLDIAIGKTFSEPYFLRRVLRKEFGNGGGKHELLVIAVHAVLLESGFVGFESNSCRPVDRLHLPDEWPSMAFSMSLSYTVPELLSNGSKEADSVVLKFQSLGHFVNVYGSLVNGPSGLYRVCVDENRLAPIIDLVWADCDKSNRMDDKDKDESLNSHPENEVFGFWKMVKDGLALPLLIDLSEKTGLSLPPCLIRLPTELKLKILELLPGNDLARIACVSSEMRYLASNNDLWKQKFMEEFGDRTAAQGVVHWKERFALFWVNKKNIKRVISPWMPTAYVDRSFFYMRRVPHPFGVPRMIGGEYDRMAGLGVPPPFRQPGQTFRICRRFSPNCRRGGFNT